MTAEPFRSPARPAPRGPLSSTPAKVLATLGVLLVAAALSTRGTTATFTTQAGQGHRITTSNPQLALGATNGAASGATSRLDLDVSALAPSGSASRSFDLTNTGSSTFGSYTLTVKATTSSLLDTDTSKGLQMQLQRCSTAWTESGTAPNLSYSCSGTTTQVLTSRPIIQTATALTGMASAAPNGVDHLLLTEALPNGADNSFKGLTSVITYTFDAA